MFSTCHKILSLLTKHDRTLLCWLILSMAVVSLIDVAGVASIMPFMAVVGNPEVINSNDKLFKLYKFTGAKTTNDFLLILGGLVFVVIIFSNSVKALVLKYQLKFVHFRLYSVSRRLLYSYLLQPYTFYMNQNAAILCKNILQEVSLFCHHVLMPLTQILSRLFVVVFIVGFLFFIDPILAVIITTTLGGSYLAIYLLFQSRLAKLGSERFAANVIRSKVVTEVFGAIKELKVLNRERAFFDVFSANAYKIENNMATSNLVSNLPSYIMECLTFGGILIIVLYFLLVKQSLGNTLAVIALYAFSGYRLMPALQGVFSAVTLLRFNVAVVDSLQESLCGVADVPCEWNTSEVNALPFERKIQLSSVFFTYPSAECPTIQDLSLTIEKNQSIGLMGPTGAGKSTLVDLILGLLPPEKGLFTVDDIAVTPGNRLMWQRNIGFVSQSVFLSDDSLAANIALGVPREDIDYRAVEIAARTANLHDFVISDLPEGYETVIGERGIRLSGGQRQRIGIARALYHDPPVLVMDEATSALDGITEEAVIQAIRNLAGRKTIITIAHRLTTLRDCDVIFVIDKGRIVESGTYEELRAGSAIFNAMAKSDVQGFRNTL
ncbi:ABC transporter ATP-binding protein [Geomonas sp. Red421]|uniref:ABC transporter ATP-binding protein n=1 Tax=Geomonas anaerohicana TaxID=2798583 RepID=A0ABS0YD25_9BACT|nr:ABC transporter ATP-binding protein [Geomonas anaerohicana]